MIRKKITTDDFVTSKYTHKRFGEEVECRPISTYFKAGLLKDYKNLNTDAEVLFFDGLKTPSDAGQGIYRKVYINAVEDIGVYIKINNHLYKRQFTGAVNLGWFGDDSAAIRTALKYGFIRFERKHYELEYDAYSLTNNVKIDLNGATITIKGTPLYGFFFRVNDYILKIFNGTIKAHKGITNIARFNNASAITTDFRTNIEFLDLEGNELEEHQIPQTNEILYRGKRLVINGRKHFNGNNRTLRVKSGLADPTEKNQLVPASYEVPEFDYSNIWKSNVDTTIVGIKTFTNFQYTKESISIFQTPATKSALEYYLQVYKSSIESQLINKFIIGTYFKINAYYISCEVYKEEVNPDTPDAAPTLVVDDTYTPNINVLFNKTRFTQFKSRSAQSVFEWGVGDYKKYKWVINKRIYSKDNYKVIKATIENACILWSDIDELETSVLTIKLVNSTYNQTKIITVNNNNKGILINTIVGYNYFELIGYSPYAADKIIVLLNNLSILSEEIDTVYPSTQRDVLKEEVLVHISTHANKNYTLIHNRFNTNVYYEFTFKKNLKNYLQYGDIYFAAHKKQCCIRLKQNTFSNIVYEQKEIQKSYYYGYTNEKITGNFVVNHLFAYSYGYIRNFKIIIGMYENRVIENMMHDILFGYAAPENGYLNYRIAPITNPEYMKLPKSVFIGDITTNEATMEEPIQDDITLHNKKHKFINYDAQSKISRCFIADTTSFIFNRSLVTHFWNDSRIVDANNTLSNLVKYFDIVILPEGKTKEDFTYEELEKMIINPT